jgi:hypothetical protein
MTKELMEKLGIMLNTQTTLEKKTGQDSNGQDT